MMEDSKRHQTTKQNAATHSDVVIFGNCILPSTVLFATPLPALLLLLQFNLKRVSSTVYQRKYVCMPNAAT